MPKRSHAMTCPLCEEPVGDTDEDLMRHFESEHAVTVEEPINWTEDEA